MSDNVYAPAANNRPTRADNYDSDNEVDIDEVWEPEYLGDR